MSQSSKPKIVVELRKLLQPLIPDFLEHRRQDVTRLRAALGKGDYDAIRDLGHNLKGLGGAYGFHPITSLGSEIEESARAENSERIKVATERLADYLDHIEVVFT